MDYVATYQQHRGQIEAILLGWGMLPDIADRTADVIAWADLHGLPGAGKVA